MKRKGVFGDAVAALIGLVIALCFLIPGYARAEDNVLTWDPTADPRVEYTQPERCVGSTIQCSAVNAPWTTLPTVPVGTWTATDANRPEGQTDNYRACFGNQDWGCGPYSATASKRVPFAAAPSVAPANLGVQ